MSDLKPVGESLMLDGVERRLLFDLNVIDEVQEHFDAPLEEIMDRLTDDRKMPGTMKFVLAALLNDEADRLKHKDGECSLKRYTEKEAGWLVSKENAYEVTLAMLNAYGASLPEPDEDETPNAQSGQQK